MVCDHMPEVDPDLRRKRRMRNRILTIMLMIMALASLAVMGALADEAENLTEQLTIKCVDTSGRAKNITDGKYTTYWRKHQTQ